MLLIAIIGALSLFATFESVEAQLIGPTIPVAPQAPPTFDRTYIGITAAVIVTVLLAYWASFDIVTTSGSLSRDAYISGRAYYKNSTLRFLYFNLEAQRWIEIIVATIWLIGAAVYVTQPMTQCTPGTGGPGVDCVPIEIAVGATFWVPVVFAIFLSRFFDGLAGALFWRAASYGAAVAVGLLAGLGYFILFVLAIWELFVPEPGQQLIEEWIIFGVAIIVGLWVLVKNIQRIAALASSSRYNGNEVDSMTKNDSRK